MTLSKIIRILKNDSGYCATLNNEWGIIWEEFEHLISYYKFGKIQGGTGTPFCKGGTREEAYSKLVNRITGKYLVNERLKEVIYIDKSLNINNL